jgi:uncharacterized membrane protein AbrB (regulator of aidB expression)
MSPDRFDRDLDRDEAGRVTQWRRKFFLTMAILGFTAVQLWAALVILSTVQLTGATQFALPLALLGAFVSVLHGWRSVAKLDHAMRRSAPGVGAALVDSFR